MPGLPDAANALLGVAGGVFGWILSLITLTFLALFLLIERPAMTRVAVRLQPAEGRDALTTSRRELDLGGCWQFAAGEYHDAPVVAGTVAPISTWGVAKPLHFVLAAMMAELLDLIPQVGATVAAVILVAVALDIQARDRRMWCMLVVQLVYERLANWYRSCMPIVYRGAGCTLSPFATIVAVSDGGI